MSAVITGFALPMPCLTYRTTTISYSDSMNSAPNAQAAAASSASLGAFRMLSTTSAMLMRWNVLYRTQSARPAMTTLAPMPRTALMRLRRGSVMRGF